MSGEKNVRICMDEKEKNSRESRVLAENRSRTNVVVRVV